MYSSLTTQETISLIEKYAAGNYGYRLPIAADHGRGCWLWDKNGDQYLDLMGSYAVLSFGHCHPRLVRALNEQAIKLPVCTQAIPNEPFARFCRDLAEFCGMEKVLPAVEGMGAVERCVKLVRRWGYQIKGVKENRAEVISCVGNFHGRGPFALAMSTNEKYKKDFGPLPQGFKYIPFGNADALEAAITHNTVAVFLEPIEGEGGVIIPPFGYLRRVREICAANNVLLVFDEIQTGFGRTGWDLACQFENVKPDIFLFSKALGGSTLPKSAIATTEKIMSVIGDGDEGSTFGGYPSGCAVAVEAIAVLKEEKLSENSKKMGAYFLNQLKQIPGPHIQEIRGRGLMIGVEVTDEDTAKRIQLELLGEKIIVGVGHNVLRLSPPLIITKEEIDWALPRIEKVLKGEQP